MIYFDDVFLDFSCKNHTTVQFDLKKTVEKTIHEVSTSTKEQIEADKKEQDEKSAKEKIMFYLKNFPIRDLRFMFFIFI
jgi:hypothetical protein